MIFEHVFKPGPGGATVEAVTRVLDSSDLQSTSILLREAVQNSSDARIKDNEEPLEITLSCYRFTSTQVSKIKELLAGSSEHKASVFLSDSINKDFYNLEIADRNTFGLKGKAGFQDNIEKNSEENFHHFIYMTGAYKPENSGGSYGYGKAALYNYSDLRTIVVYTRVRNGNSFETRFIICKIDERANSSISGRVWWGKEAKYSGGTYAAPLLNEEADEWASAFGMKTFSENETGTDILILKPQEKNSETNDTENLNKKFSEVFKYEFKKHIIHWFWPRLATQKNKNKINFTLILEGTILRLPVLSTTYPYNQFAKSLEDFYNHDSSTSSLGFYSVTHNNYQNKIGNVVISKCLSNEQAFPQFHSFAPITIAYMRDVEFIVEYKTINIQIEEGWNCFGIFHTDENAEINEYFRSMENQTHDKWSARTTEKCRYKLINRINEQIPLFVKDYFGMKSQTSNESKTSAYVAEYFGKFIGFGNGGGASLPDKDHTGSSSPSNGKKDRGPSIKNSERETDIELSDDNTKTMKLYYSVTNIKSSASFCFIPRIQTPDGLYNASQDEIIVESLQNIETKTFATLKNDHFSVTSNGEYILKIKVLVDCVFDIEIKKK